MSGLKKMKLSSIYKEGERLLQEAGIQDADFDSLCLLEHFFGADRTALILHGGKIVDDRLCESFFSAVDERRKGRPLQYIIGKWSFMGYDFYVGEGVLIPRNDTETVVEAAAEYLKDIKNPKVIDLCSGSGAIAVSIAKMFPNSQVTALEYSGAAIEYLNKNIVLNGADNVTIFKGDVTRCNGKFANEIFDLVVSNPPYIESEEIDTLQTELKYEPRMALDGGSDGLFFYRVITEKWAEKIKSGGMLLYEVGEDQFEPVSRMMKNQGFKDIMFKPDLQGFKRAISGLKI